METLKPTIRKCTDFVIVGSVDHGFPIPPAGVQELVSSLDGIVALTLETPKEFVQKSHAMSTEVLTVAAAGKVPVEYLPGEGFQDVGAQVLKYAPVELAELYVPCLYMRNSSQSGQEFSFDPFMNFVLNYRRRFGFLDAERALGAHLKVMGYYLKQGLDDKELDDFSYDFEKFFGDIKEYEFWLPALKAFREKFKGKVGACVGDYHVHFVQSVFEGKEQKPPHWESHIDIRREDLHTPQDAAFLKRVYAHISEALSA